MKYPTIFDLIADKFGKADISYVLIGGFAVNAYKVTRQTADIDFFITKEDYDKVRELLKKEGYREGPVQKVFARLEGTRPYLMDLDFLFVDRETLTKIRQTGKRIKIAGNTFVIPSIEHLIALKLHAMRHNPEMRELKDLMDIIQLVKTNKINVRTSQFRDLCLTYGTKDLYTKIIDAI